MLTGAADDGSWESFRDRLTSEAHETLGIAASQRQQSSLPPQFADLVNRRRSERLNRDRPLYRFLRTMASRALRAVEEARVRDVCGWLSSHLFTCNSGSGPTFRAISELKWKGTPPDAVHGINQRMAKP